MPGSLLAQRATETKPHLVAEAEKVKRPSLVGEIHEEYWQQKASPKLAEMIEELIREYDAKL